MKPNRKRVMSILRQLEPHSPAWAKEVREYIVHLECELGINPERNKQIADSAGHPMSSLKALLKASVKPKGS